MSASSSLSPKNYSKWKKRIVDENFPTSDSNLSEVAFIQVLTKMFTHDVYHFPISIAEREYRETSYKMASAGLLEDLFIESLEHHIIQNEPLIQFKRAPLGKAKWDYEVNGLIISHKVLFEVNRIALIWDATLKLETWNSDFPFLIDLARTSKKSVKIGSLSQILKIEFLTKDSPQKSQSIALVHWPRNGKIVVIDDEFPKFKSDSYHTEGELFTQLWSSFVKHKKTIPSNELDFFLIQGEAKVGQEYEVLEPGLFRSGFYLFPKDLLQALPVVANNRGQLLSKATVSDLLQKSVDLELMVPMTTWFQFFVGNLKKDLYFKQRDKYEEIIQKFMSS